MGAVERVKEREGGRRGTGERVKKTAGGLGRGGGREIGERVKESTWGGMGTRERAGYHGG